MDHLHPTNGENTDREASILDGDVSESKTLLCDLYQEFWGDSCKIESVVITIQPPMKPLVMLEKLGPSPFERGSFPLIGFLATTFDKVSHFALERAGYESISGTTSATDIQNT